LKPILQSVSFDTGVDNMLQGGLFRGQGKVTKLTRLDIGQTTSRRSAPLGYTILFFLSLRTLALCCQIVSPPSVQLIGQPFVPLRQNEELFLGKG
jgi:hypothetical protein